MGAIAVGVGHQLYGGAAMRAITLTQPYATLVALGAKHIETRSWATSYRGPLAIHAGKGLGPVGGIDGLQELCAQEPFCSVLTIAGRQHYARLHSLRDMVEHEFMPLGAIIAVCELHDCRPTTTEAMPGKRGWSGYVGEKLTYWDLTDQERAFGDYTPGRYAWLLSNIRVLPEPIPVRGALGLWRWEGPIPQ
jgi:hypothetical protein